MGHPRTKHKVLAVLEKYPSQDVHLDTIQAESGLTEKQCRDAVAQLRKVDGYKIYQGAGMGAKTYRLEKEPDASKPARRRSAVPKETAQLAGRVLNGHEIYVEAFKSRNGTVLVENQDGHLFKLTPIE